MKALAGNDLSAFHPADTAGRSQHCPGRAVGETPSSPSLASNMNPASRPLGPAWERQAKLFASPLCSWAACCSQPAWGHSLTGQHCQGSGGPKPRTLPLSSALLCVLRNHPIWRS